MIRLTHRAVLPTLALSIAAAGTHAAVAQSAQTFFKRGQAAEARDDDEAAYDNYAKAFQKKPGEERYKVSYERLRTDAGAAHIKHGDLLRDQGDYSGALTEYLRALAIDPSNELASESIRAVRLKLDGENSTSSTDSSMSPGEHKALLELGSTAQLKPVSTEPLTLKMTQDSKVVYQTIGKEAGINVLFDPDYTSKTITVDLANTTLLDALRITGVVSGTFWRAISPNTIFVAANTRTKRTELDQQAVQTFYLTNMSQTADLNEIVTAIRNTIGGAGSAPKVNAVPSQNAIVMRGTPDELLLAGKLVNDLDKARPEVVVDVAVLEVSKEKIRQYGIQLPQTIGLAFQSANASTTTTSTTTGTTGTTTNNGTSGTTSGLTLNNLAHLNSTDFAVTLGSAQAELMLSDSSTKIVQNPRIRATDGLESSVKIGERVPIATGSYQAGVATAITSSLVNTQFQYQDVGVNITMKPAIHYDGDVSMKLKIEVSSEGNSVNLGGISEPIFTQRVAEQNIRLRSGEVSMLTGILQHQATNSISGWPGLGELPLIKYMFATRDQDNSDTEIVFLLIPHIVRATELTPLNLRQIDSGTINDVQLRRIDVGPLPDGNAGINTGAKNVLGTSTQGTPSNVSNPAQMPAGLIPGQNPGAAASSPGAAPAMGSTPLGGPVTLDLVASNPNQSVGNTFQEQVKLAGGTDIYSVPLQVQYDHSKLTLVNVDTGDLLGRDGQTVSLAHRNDEDNGMVTISTSRPPGVGGVSGSGTVCTLTFQAKAAGDATISLPHPVVRNSKQQTIPATGTQGVIHIK